VGGAERPRAVEPPAGPPRRRPAICLLLDELVGAAVPDLDSAGAVVPLRDLAGKGRVIQGVILDVHRESPLSGLERHTLGNRPGGERPVALEPEVVVEPPGVVALAA